MSLIIECHPSIIVSLSVCCVKPPPKNHQNNTLGHHEKQQKNYITIIVVSNQQCLLWAIKKMHYFEYIFTATIRDIQ